MVRSADHPFLGLTLLERVNLQSDTNKPQEGKISGSKESVQSRQDRGEPRNPIMPISRMGRGVTTHQQ